MKALGFNIYDVLFFPDNWGIERYNVTLCLVRTAQFILEYRWVGVSLHIFFNGCAKK